jgi:hypothetical protein
MDQHFPAQLTPFQAKNFFDLVEKTHNNPFLASEVYKLYPGPKFSRIERETSDLCEESVIDSDRLFSIVHYNSFSSTYDRVIENKMDSLVDQNQGLWIVPSYFNHSCLENTITHFFSDFMMIYTSIISLRFSFT